MSRNTNLKMLNHDREWSALLSLVPTPLKFWEAYANYLERCNIVSTSRLILHKAILATIKELKDAD